MISFYFLSSRFSLKREGLFDARVALITKKKYGFAVYILSEFKDSLNSASCD